MLSQRLTTSGAYFVILEAAVQAGVPPLCEQALTKICSKFSHAVMTDTKGWTDLSQEAVMLVLCNDRLQVHFFCIYQNLYCVHMKWLHLNTMYIKQQSIYKSVLVCFCMQDVISHAVTATMLQFVSAFFNSGCAFSQYIPVRWLRYVS